MKQDWINEFMEINFSGRVGRLLFFKSSLFRIFLVLLSLIIGAFLVGMFGMNESLFGLILMLLWGYLIILQISFNIRRFHDFDWSGWSIFLLFIPLIDIIFLLMLFLREGNSGRNNYGE